MPLSLRKTKMALQDEIDRLLLLNGELANTLGAENLQLRAALEIIAGRRQCLDNLMSNQEVAIAALEQRGRDGE